MSFDKTPIKVIDGFEACGLDFVIEAKITSQDGTDAFIDEIEKNYSLTKESNTTLSYDNRIRGSGHQIWCNREDNICILRFSVSS